MAPHLTPGRAIIVLLLALLLSPQIAAAQVDVTLFVDPYPSPYIADWEIQAGIISLTVMNGPTDQELVIVLTIEESTGRQILRVESDPQLFAANEVVTYSSVSEVGGSIDYDTSYEDNILRTGRLPEGEFQICVRVEDAFGTEVSPRQCEAFTILLPDPAYLLAPMNEEIVRTETPFFQWTPLQLPLDFQLSFVLQIVEVLEGQMPYEAITSNILHFEDPDITVESYQYPLDAPPFEEGKTYAWWVLALDQEGLAVTANQGRSEIWTFTWSPEESELFVSGDPQSLRLVPASQASGPLADFDTSTFETVVKQIGLLIDAGAAIEISPRTRRGVRGDRCRWRAHLHRQGPQVAGHPWAEDHPRQELRHHGQLVLGQPA